MKSQLESSSAIVTVLNPSRFANFDNSADFTNFIGFANLVGLGGSVNMFNKNLVKILLIFAILANYVKILILLLLYF